MENKKKSKFDWIPLKQIGPFVFGDPIGDYVEALNLSHIPEEYNEKVNWEVYSLCSDIRIYTEIGKIVAVSTSNFCVYKGYNIIGALISDVIKEIGIKPDSIEPEELSDGIQAVYDFDDLGLQLWVKADIILTAICSGHSDDD